MFLLFKPGFFKEFYRVPRIENRVRRIRENYHRVPKTREIGSLQVYTGYLTLSLKKLFKLYASYVLYNHVLILDQHKKILKVCIVYTREN